MPKPTTTLEHTDNFGVTLREHLAVQATVAAPAGEQILERARAMTTNFLYGFGLPTTPRQLLQFATEVATGTLTGGVLDGAFTLTARATASEEEQEANAAKQGDTYGVDVRSLFERLGIETEDEVLASVGGYL